MSQALTNEKYTTRGEPMRQNMTTGLRGIIPEPLINIPVPVRKPSVIRGDQPTVALLPGSLHQDQRSTQPDSKPFPLILPRQPRNDPGGAPVPVPNPDLLIKKIP